MDWLLSQIGQAFEFVHKQGVIHGDLRPDNILVEQIGRDYMLVESIAACDFGLSKRLGQTTLTKTAVGTAGYSAPEQPSKRSPFDRRSARQLEALQGSLYGRDARL